MKFIDYMENTGNTFKHVHLYRKKKQLQQKLEANFWSCLQNKVETVDKSATDLKTKE